jgi:acyl carrier protein
MGACEDCYPEYWKQEEDMSIEKQICDIVSDSVGHEVKRSDNLKSIGADSLNLTEIMIDVEEKFELTISDSEFTELKTIDDIITFIEKKKC